MNKQEYVILLLDFTVNETELPLTCFTSDANESSWTGAVEAVYLINTRSIVQTRVTRTFIDLCNKRNRKQLKTEQDAYTGIYA